MANPGFGVGRAPCGGWPATPKTARGSCYQHRKAADDGFTVYQNVTKMDDVALGTFGGVSITPRASNSDLPPCASAPSGCKSEYDPMNPGGQLCDEWRAGSEAPQNVTTPNTVDYNAYSATGSTINFSKCRQLGYKNVQGKLLWVGRLGFDSQDHLPYTDFLWDATHNQYDGGICACRDELGSPDTSKYRTAEISVVMDQTPYGAYGGGGLSPVTSLIEYKLSTDAHSGVTTLSDCTYTPGPTSPLNAQNHPAGPYWTSYTVRQFAGAVGNWTIESLTSRFFGFWSAAASLSGHSTARSGTTWTLTEDSSGNVLEEVTCDFTGSFSRVLYGYYTDGGGDHQYEIYREEVTISATSLSFTEHDIIVPTGADYADRIEVNTEITVSMSDEFTKSDVTDDMTTLLALWDLGNNAVYQFRTDSFVGVAPLVTRNQVDGSPLFDSTMDCSWTDPSATIADGSIKGAPNPAGYEGHFDFNHRTHFCCLSAGSPGYYVGMYGAKSGVVTTGDATDAYMPDTATCWTENGTPSDPIAAGNLPPGAWNIWNEDTLYSQKWCEIKVPWKSYNYARPCNQDRFLLDESSVRCVAELTSGDGSGGSPWAIVMNSDPSASPVVSSDTVLFCMDGNTAVCTATKIDATHYTLVKVCDAPVRTDCGTGIMGKVRYNTAAGICGRVAVTAATNESPIKITVESTTALRTGDHVDISGVLGNTAANVSNQAITVISDTQFTLDGTTGTGDYTSGGYCSVHGATSYTWNDDQSKGDFLGIEYRFNYRDYQERDRVIAETCSACTPGGAALRLQQEINGLPREVNDFTVTSHCLAFTVCDPQVMVCSPNSETFTNQKTVSWYWPDPDLVYGSRWQHVYVQQWPDLLWEAPHKECEFDGIINAPTPCTMTQDNGGCESDTCDGVSGDIYYPHAPMREASNLVAGTPSLPAGIYKNILTYTELQSATPPDGFTVPPAGGSGYGECSGVVSINEIETPWGLYMAEYLCVCGEGRFADTYEEEGARVRCPS